MKPEDVVKLIVKKKIESEDDMYDGVEPMSFLERKAALEAEEQRKLAEHNTDVGEHVARMGIMERDETDEGLKRLIRKKIERAKGLYKEELP